jgi:sugar-phosphatase
MSASESHVAPGRSERAGTSTRLACRAILFDLDGVLVDSTRCIERCWSAWAIDRGLDPVAVVRTAHGRRVAETVRLVAPHLDEAKEGLALEQVESHETEGLAEVPGVAPLVRLLPASSWAIVTSAVRSVAEHRLRYVGLKVPVTFVTADQVTYGKPDPEGYLEAAARLGLEPRDCIVIEDSPSGIEAARAAGMRAIGIYGAAEPSTLKMADAVVHAFGDIRVEVLADGGLVLSP